jgi:HlyD family secretion protein
MAKNNINDEQNKRKSFRIIGAIVLVAVVGLILILFGTAGSNNRSNNEQATFIAKRGPLTISVLESGTIKAREQIIIKNEVEGRTSIISLIPEGTHVNKGELLIELDASTLQDNKIDQEIRVQNVEASYINSKENLAVVQNQAKSDIDKAKLTLEFAQQDLKQYKEGEYPNQKTAAENAITLAEEELARAEETLAWSQKLYDKKYMANTELQADKLTVSRRKNDLILAQNDFKLLENFTYHRKIRQLESDLGQAEMALERTERKAKADIIQAEAEFKAKEAEYNRQKDKLTKIEDQIKKAKIYAPADGMVIYATSARRGGWRDNREPLAEGVEVFERQELIYLPTATSSMAEVDIHESSLEKVRVGLPAIITVDALPGKKFLGSVARIAPLPDPQSMWMNPDLKVYNSDVYLESNDPSLRTGMSCKVEIIIAQYEDEVYVPVQSVLRVGAGHVVYVAKGGAIKERNVEIGFDNNRMVRIISGLSEGELVLLTPPLKSATIESGSQLAGTGSSGSIDTSDTLKQQINDKLKVANGTQQKVQQKDQQGSESEKMRQQFENMSEEERQKIRERFENMTEEEREQMRRRFENMSEEEREQMRKRFQGSGGPPRQQGQEGNP